MANSAFAMKEVKELYEFEAKMKMIQVPGRCTRFPMLDLCFLVMIGVHWATVRDELASAIRNNWAACGDRDGLLADLADGICEY